MANLKVEVNRRRVPRRTMLQPVGILAAGGYVVERSYQVGEGGMMISSQKSLVVGQSLVMGFYIFGRLMILVRGIVRSFVPAKAGYPNRYGVEFQNLGFQYKREIRNFVALGSATESQAAQEA